MRPGLGRRGVGPVRRCIDAPLGGTGPDVVGGGGSRRREVGGDGPRGSVGVAVRNDSGGLVNPEGLLRFWVDCRSGARRNDVEIFPNTRLFFTTGVWDNPSGVEEQDREYREVLDKLQTMLDASREEKESDKPKGIFEELLSFPRQVKDAEEFDRLKRQKDDFESALPPLGSATAANGVQIAPTGSIVIKGNNTPDWMPGSEYLILGTFSTKPLQ